MVLVVAVVASSDTNSSSNSGRPSMTSAAIPMDTEKAGLFGIKELPLCICARGKTKEEKNVEINFDLRGIPQNKAKGCQSERVQGKEKWCAIRTKEENFVCNDCQKKLCQLNSV